jgi:type II secretory pathway component GspD/PulD (secretin)
MESLRKVLAAIETIRSRSERSYVAEVYFIRVNEDKFVQLTADLEIKNIDIFSSAFNVDELFQMFVNADAGIGGSQISQRPVLYLSEGREVTFSDGKEITKEQHSINENGSRQVSGYEKFTDGTQLTMKLNRVSDLSYTIDMNLSISMFDKSDKSEIPATDKSELKAEGLLVRDSQVYYVGSLRRDIRTEKTGLFSFDNNKSYDMLTIWLRVRELKSTQ